MWKLNYTGILNYKNTIINLTKQRLCLASLGVLGLTLEVNYKGNLSKAVFFCLLIATMSINIQVLLVSKKLHIALVY